MCVCDVYSRQLLFLCGTHEPLWAYGCATLAVPHAAGCAHNVQCVMGIVVFGCAEDELSPY